MIRTGLKMSSTTSTIIPSWIDLKSKSESTIVGKSLVAEVELRSSGKGSAHVQNKLRQFKSEEDPQITLFRDHAGWCPYCQKTMLLVEEKEIPIKIDLVPMRSYGDKPREFLQKVPNGLLPAIEVNGQVITESQVIMELLDKWHPPSEGYKAMLPVEEDRKGWARYDSLSRLERELFSWWCTLVFRPEGGVMGGMINNPFKKRQEMSEAMRGFLDCIGKVDKELKSTKGPWFFDEHDHPTMIDFIYVSHVERMLASVAFWKGLNLRDQKWKFDGLNSWLEAFEKRESYLAFKSDYFTHVMDIPPQYGPGFDGGFEEDRTKFAKKITGRDGSWNLPLEFDDHLQPLYKGPPLPLTVLKSMDIEPDSSGSYESADPIAMEKACRHMAAWKLAGNGANVARFAARGGPNGSTNPRKSFGAQLADPYAEPDKEIQPLVDSALRIVCACLLTPGEKEKLERELIAIVTDGDLDGVKSSLAYLRDRVGVPRDLPLASARYLRAYLNWAIDVLSK
eukprot:CAMPEP_0178914376 /NCGR_PEP_ID=MMETSP0786-20121207/11392_1 /TAXON_ID=186022 /ORGANISM="Thalassionema frauenfeldii, Strain CCMP 1798" /LENGTH=507 /DNA_ID=CAMNT_0020587279 /DNA_START=198 /DNA_END=1721 /DNA_ORIENTATION=-